MNYEPLHAFALKHRVPYNELCVAAREALAAPQPVPVAWRYQDARGHYRYRKYVAGFDVEYAILKPVPLYAVTAAAQSFVQPLKLEKQHD